MKSYIMAHDAKAGSLNVHHKYAVQQMTLPSEYTQLHATLARIIRGGVPFKIQNNINSLNIH